MSTFLEIQIDAPFEPEDALVEIELETGAKQCAVLRGGYLRVELPAAARQIRLLTARVAQPEEPAGLPRRSMDDVAAVPVDVEVVHEHGVPVPADGRLRIALRWGAHSLVSEGEPGDRRFGAWEHLQCAGLVGQSVDGGKLRFGGVAAPFDASTPLPVGRTRLPFGKIIAMAGDFYAHFDDAAVRDFADAWPPLTGVSGWLAGGDYRRTTLVGDSPEAVNAVIDAVERDRNNPSAASEFLATTNASLTGGFPLRRYLALASQNFCHFACPQTGVDPTEGDSLRLYRRYHDRARREAAAANNDVAKLLSALALDAFGCHQLTDRFAAGHIRVPRRLLARLGTIRGSLYMSKRMHDEDNALGLWCRARGGDAVIWRAYGDGKLLAPQASAHLAKVREAVRRSAAEVFAAFRGVSVTERAEDLVPVPLEPGASPRASDRVLVPAGPAPGPNHYPMYWFDAEDHIWVRDGGPSENQYRPYDNDHSPSHALEFAA